MKPKQIQNKRVKPTRKVLKNKPKIMQNKNDQQDLFDKIKQVRLRISEQMQKEVEMYNLQKNIKLERQNTISCNNDPINTNRTVEIPIKELQKALNDLNKYEDRCTFKKNKCKRFITDLVKNNIAADYSACSYTNLCYEIQKSILNHDWNSLTDYFLLLLDGPASLRQVIWKVIMHTYLCYLPNGLFFLQLPHKLLIFVT